jgi:hypothetical protein
MRISSTQDTEMNYLTCCVHGDSGSGKTTSLGTLPQDRTFIAIGERSAIPLREMDFKCTRFETWTELCNIVAAFIDPESIADKATRAVVDACTIFSLDSLSEASTCLKNHIVGVERRKLLSNRSGGATELPENIYEDLMTKEDWGLYLSKMLGIIRCLTQIKKHVIVTCRSAWRKDKDGHDTLRTMNLSGASALEAPAYFDLVLYMESVGSGEEEKRTWRTFNDGRIIAKDSTGKLVRYEDTDWGAVFTKILS